MPADLKPFRDSVVRIIDDDRGFFGIGYLVAPSIVITCAHVVSDALSLEPDEYPEGSVLLNRPLAEDEIEKNQYVRGHVTANGWFPKSSDGKGVPVDLAVLELDIPLIQAKGMCASLATSLELSKNIDFVAYGGLLGHMDNLIDVKGVVGDILGNGFYHLDVSASDYKIEEGCSGAPACDIATGEVIGLIAQREMDTEIDAAFLIPNSQLRQALHIAAPYTLGIGASGKRLSKLREWARKQIQPHDLSLSQSVQRFIGNYSGTLENPIPFAGRDQELRELDHWLDKGGGSFRLLSGAAGLGKSALVLHWIESLLEQYSERQIVFAPISIRFETSEELRGLRLLHSWLTSLFPDLRFSPEAKPDQNDYREKILHAWQFMENRTNELFLLVIDGADEAARGWILKDVLCYEIPGNLNILLTARHKPGSEDGDCWLDDFKFGPGTKVCKPIELPPLSRNAVGEAIVQLGYPLDDFVERDGILDELYRLTDKGDPLLVTLWVGQLWQDRNRTSQFKADELRILQPSFKGFLEIWRKEQEKLWQNSNLDVDWRDFEWGLYVLSLARGPLLMDELHEVIKRLELEAQWDYRPMRSAFKNAIRLVAGNGEDQGLVFVHPRLAYHFQERLQQQGMRFSRIQQGYIKWGADVVRQLNDGKQWCSSYLLQHYTDHIKDAHLPAEEALDNHYLPLLGRGWHQAWHEHEGVYSGFLRDLNRIDAALQDFNRATSNRGLTGSLRIGEELACSLIHSSIISLAGKIPPVLIANMVKADLWTSKRALALTEQLPDPEDRFKCFLDLSHLTSGIERRNALRLALVSANRISKKSSRVEALSTIAGYLQDEERKNILSQALKTTAEIWDKESPFPIYSEVTIGGVIRVSEGPRIKALNAIVGHIHDEPELMGQALEATTRIWDEGSRARVLTAVANHLQGEERKNILRQALEATTRISDEGSRARVLTAVANHLQGEERKNILSQALEATTRISDEGSRARVLTAIADHLQGEERKNILRQALEATTRISDKESRVEPLSLLLVHCRVVAMVSAEILTAIADHFQGEERKNILRQALEAATKISHEESLVEVLTAIADHLQGEERKNILRQALEAITRISDEWFRAEALTEIAGHFQGEPELLRQALEATTRISDKGSRVKALTAIADHLQGEERKNILRQALEAATKISDEESRAWVLTAIVDHLQGEERKNILRQALEAATKISDEESRVEVLTAIVDHLQGKELKNILRQALEAATKISDEESRAWVLTAIVDNLQGKELKNILSQALEAATKISDEESRVEVLTAIADHLQGKELKNILRQALEAASMISDEGSRAWVLTAIADHLQGKELKNILRQALEAATKISDEESRVEVLTAIADHLQGKELKNILRQALKAATKISDKGSRVEALIAIVDHFQGKELKNILSQALEAATKISDEESCAWVLTAIADHLQGKELKNILSQALEAATKISDEESRVEAFIAIANHFQGEELKNILSQTLEAVTRISNEGSRVEALIAIANHLQGEPELLRQALEAATRISNECWRVRVLTAVANHLQGEERKNILRQALDEAATGISDEGSRVEALTAIADHFQGEERKNILRQALEAATKISNEGSRVKALVAVLLNWPQPADYNQYRNWLNVVGYLGRDHFLAIIKAIIPTIEALGGQKAIVRTAKAIEETAHWWP